PTARAGPPNATALTPIAADPGPHATAPTVAAAPAPLAEVPTKPSPTTAPFALPTQTNCAAACEGASSGAAAARPVASTRPRSVPPESALVVRRPARPRAKFGPSFPGASRAAALRSANASSNVNIRNISCLLILRRSATGAQPATAPQIRARSGC